jgi:hypothetical protein
MKRYMAYAPNSQQVSDLLREEDPELARLTLPERIARAQALVCKYVPEGVSLADELIAERRREAARER